MRNMVLEICSCIYVLSNFEYAFLQEGNPNKSDSF